MSLVAPPHECALKSDHTPGAPHLLVLRRVLIERPDVRGEDGVLVGLRQALQDLLKHAREAEPEHLRGSAHALLARAQGARDLQRCACTPTRRNIKVSVVHTLCYATFDLL